MIFILVRFSDSDLDIELRGKTSRPKRSRGGQNDSNRKGRSRNAQSNDDLKNSPSAAAKRRNKVSILLFDFQVQGAIREFVDTLLGLSRGFLDHPAKANRGIFSIFLHLSSFY